MSLISKLSKNKRITNHIVNDLEKPQEFINTGSIALNILFSGRLDGGVPVGKMSQVAAPSALGKSMIGLKLMKNAIKRGMEVVLIDTEYAFDVKTAEKMGIDMDKVMVIQEKSMETIQSIVANIGEELDRTERENIFILLDSWRGLVTSKTMDDSIAGQDKKDMTVPSKKNTLAGVLNSIHATVFVINGVYDSLNQYDPLAIPGGRGLYFESSCIVMPSSKAKDKESSGDITGAIITAQTKKSRFAKELTKLKYLISYDGGIHPVYGILDDALECGVVEKPSNGWYTRPSVESDRKWREKEVWGNWKEFWAPILTSDTFKEHIISKYTFNASEFHDEDLDF